MKSIALSNETVNEIIDLYLDNFTLPEKPSFQPQETIYVKEQLRGDGQPGNRRVGVMRYGADGEMVLVGHSDHIWGYKSPVLPPSRMPKWAARIELKIVGVRQNKVNDRWTVTFHPRVTVYGVFPEGDWGEEPPDLYRTLRWQP